MGEDPAGFRDGWGQNPTRDLARPEGFLANLTRPEQFTEEPEPTRNSFFLTRVNFFLTRAI